MSEGCDIPTEESLIKRPLSYIFESRISTAAELRQEGNKLFRDGNFTEAISYYDRGLFHVNFDEGQMFELLPQHLDQVTSSQAALHLNKGLCLEKLMQPLITPKLSPEAAEAVRGVLAEAKDVLCARSGHFKGLCLKARAYRALRDFDSSAEAFMEAEKVAAAGEVVVDPKERAALRRQLNEVREDGRALERAHREQQRAAYAGKLPGKLGDGRSDETRLGEIDKEAATAMLADDMGGHTEEGLKKLEKWRKAHELKERKRQNEEVAAVRSLVTNGIAVAVLSLAVVAGVVLAYYYK